MTNRQYSYAITITTTTLVNKLETYPDPRHAGLARHHVVSRNEKVHEISRDFTRERESFGTNKLRVMETTVRITP